MRRREFLATSAGSTLAKPQRRGKRIACLSSTYHVRSHSDNFITRFLEGYWIGERFYEPPFQVASLWMDQLHPADIGQRLARAHGVRITSSIADALTLGTSNLAVDGVILVCEHGNYPHNEKNQQLYPRFEFFEQVVKVFRSTGQTCPVFVDKQLSYDWKKAKRMYDWSRELKFPLMAGSSVPVTFRRPELDPPLGAEMDGALAVGGGWIADGGIFHILETLQAFVERRKGGESGVRSVQLLQDSGVSNTNLRQDLVRAALARQQRIRSKKTFEEMKPVLGIIEYRDGFVGNVLALSDVSEYLAAVSLKGNKLQSTLCYIPIENSNNFSMLVHGITQMIQTGRTPYPVERTLLVTGALAGLMDSGFQKGKRLETPELKIAYKAPARSWYAAGEGS